MKMNYDIVIVAHEKDFNNIKFIVEHSEKNLEFDSIHLILSEREEYKDSNLLKKLTSKPVYIHKESDILKIDKTRIKHRPNWIYQMMLKFFQNVTDNDNYLIIEADCIILKKLDFFIEDKTVFYLCSNQNHSPYFKFNNLLGFGREFNHSFISEFLMYNRQIIKDLLLRNDCLNANDFMEIIYNNVTEDCYPADYELYCNFVYKFHNEKQTIDACRYNLMARHYSDYPSWTDSEIVNLIKINKDKDVISFHTYKD